MYNSSGDISIWIYMVLRISERDKSFNQKQSLWRPRCTKNIACEETIHFCSIVQVLLCRDTDWEVKWFWKSFWLHSLRLGSGRKPAFSWSLRFFYLKVHAYVRTHTTTTATTLTNDSSADVNSYPRLKGGILRAWTIEYLLCS